MDTLLHFARRVANDKDFGPQYLNQFDFTLTFEASIFNILPASIIIFVCPLFIFHYNAKPVVAPQSAMLWSKIAAAIALLAAEILRSVLWNKVSEHSTDVSLAGTSMSCIAALCIVLILGLEYRHALRPSSFLSIYLSIGLILDAVQSRSMLLRTIDLHPAGFATAAIAGVKLVLLVMQEIPKRVAPEYGPDEPITKDEVGGFWTRTLMLWINGTMFFGFRNTLTMDDLANLGPNFSARRLMNKFDPIWAKADKESRHALLKATLLALFWPFVFAAIPRVLFTGFNFTGPFLIQRILSNLRSTSEPYFAKGGLIGSIALVYVGVAITRVTHTYMMNRVGTLIRGMLIGQVIKKNLSLKTSDAKKAAVLTLMTADVEGVVTNSSKSHDIWMSFFEIGIGMYFMSLMIGNAWFLPAIPISIAILISFKLSDMMIPATAAWNKSIQNRVSLTSDSLRQIRSIKMLGLEKVTISFIQKLRIQEVLNSAKVRKLRVILVSSLPLNAWGAPMFALIGGLFWTTFTNGLVATSIFATLALTTLLDGPMFLILNCWPGLGAMIACFDRIQQFLLLPEQQDLREVVDFAATASASGGNEKPSSDNPKDSSGETSHSANTCISLTDVSVASNTTEEAVLKRINLAIARGSLATVAGPVGVGKSVFLKTLLGETTLLQGLIQIASKLLAYCDQRAWLPNTTIREAITGEIEFVQEWYDLVVHACALNHDFAQLDKGDQTMTGTDGSILSGGQKQRIALARAAYTRAPIVVLDDVVSGLDRDTADRVFDRVFGPNGLFKSHGRTVIIATHSVRFLNECDQLIVVDENGNVTANSADVDVDNIVYADEERSENNSNESSEPAVQPAIISRSAQDISFTKRSSGSGGDLSLYKYFLGPVSRPVIITFLFSIATVALMETMPLIYVRIWVGMDPTNKSYFWGFVALACFCVVANGACAWLYMMKVMPKIGLELHEKFLQSVMRAPVPFLTAIDNGALLNRFSQDMSLLNQEMPMAFYGFLYILCVAITHTVIIATGARYAGLIIPFTIAILYVLQYFYLRTSRQLRILDLESKTPLYTKLSETCAGLEHIRAFGWEERVLDESLKLLDHSQKAYYYMFCAQRWLVLVLEVYSGLVATLIVTMALLWEETTSQPSLGLALISCIDHSTMMRMLVERWTLIEISLGAVARLRDFINDTPVEKNKPGWPQPLSDVIPMARVEFKNVGASYTTTSPARMALEGVNMVANPGEEIVIRGRTGSGKSTLVLALINRIEYTGSITINDVEVSDVSHYLLGNLIITIPQDPIELPGSVRDNLWPLDILQPRHQRMLEYGVTNALEIVGLDTYVDERGGIHASMESMQFSHGQKQLIAFARAIIHKRQHSSKILLMDEATSNLDQDTEAWVRHLLATQFADCTKIIVTHKPTLFHSCDAIYTMEDGHLTGR